MDIFESFCGSGLHFVFFLACIVWLLLREKDKGIKDMLGKYSLFILLLFFCPIWIVVMRLREDGDILYRILWLLPIGIVIAYTVVTLLYELPEKKRIIGILGVLLLIILSGQYIYANPYFKKASNTDHIPQEVVDVCDEIIVPGREIRAAFPNEFISYVRQYTSLICMPFGRDTLISDFTYDSSLQDMLNADIIDTEVTSVKLREELTPYVVVDCKHVLSDPFEMYGFNLVKSVDGFDIYLDQEAYIGLDFE